MTDLPYRIQLIYALIEPLERKIEELQSAFEAARDSALEEAASWHDERRRDGPDAFEMELHAASAAAIRNKKGRAIQTDSAASESGDREV